METPARLDRKLQRSQILKATWMLRSGGVGMERGAMAARAPALPQLRTCWLEGLLPQLSPTGGLPGSNPATPTTCIRQSPGGREPCSLRPERASSGGARGPRDGAPGSSPWGPGADWHIRADLGDHVGTLPA